MTFPEQRMRRLRRTPAMRRLVAETRLSVNDLVAPLFVREGIDEPQPIASLPGVMQHTRDSLVKEVRRLSGIGVPGVILFGVPARKDAEGSEAWNPDGIVQLALRDLRDELGDEMVVMADLCLDEYTDHGHCGVLTPDGVVDNDVTIELYGRVAVAQAEAGAAVVAPLFGREGIDAPEPIASMPGVVQHTRESLRTEARELADLGLPAVILFGIPEHKDATGSGAYDPDGIVQVALRDLRDEVGESLVLVADLCLDEYTDHGHCGIVRADRSRPGGPAVVDNDATLELYARIALAQADAGADIVAPSGMMDGQVGAIRDALDGTGYDEVAILAYAAKYASALYGPFRDAVDVTITGGGDRKGYQQDWHNRREALAEVELDVAEGADIVMVKPALAYLDVIASVRARFDLPVAAYHVSGEYAMVKAAAERGWLDGPAVALEHLTAVKRAGADIILTYFARELAEGGLG